MAVTRTRNSPASGMVNCTWPLPSASVWPCEVVITLACTLLPVPAAHLRTERRGNGLLVVVLRGDVDGRGAALGVHVRVRLGGEIEAAVGGQRETVAGNFAIARIGDARLDAIDQVLLLRARPWSES